MIQTLSFYGDVPESRFGHTITLLEKDIAVLYGGAVGYTSLSFTSDTYLCDLKHLLWKKLQPAGDSPGIRAAHTACAVEGQLVIYGGALKSGELADSEIYLLELRRAGDKGAWSIRRTVGPTPGRRYGHSMSYLRPYLMVFGGNMGGSQSVNDVWMIEINNSNANWVRLEVPQLKPRQRAYHSSSVCLTGKAKGMMVIFGGRLGEPSKNFPLKDTWGLRVHRDGNWDWVQAPYTTSTKVPSARYQHSTHFYSSLMLVIGGRLQQFQQSHGLDIYDTQSSEWHAFNCKDSDTLRRFRHVSFINQNHLYIHGGFQMSEPTLPTRSIIRINLVEAIGTIPALTKYVRTERMEPARALSAEQGLSAQQHFPLDSMRVLETEERSRPRLCSQVFQMRCHPEDQYLKIVKKVNIMDLAEQRRRLIQPETIRSHDRRYQGFLQQMLNPKATARNFINSSNKGVLLLLLEDVSQIVSKQPTLLRLRPPAKIFGDLYGQYQDLLQIFTNFGFPSEQPPNGDIDSFDYIFLGNYVDYGSKGLEVIFLLFLLKVTYPEQLHLLRGMHQDVKINTFQGFAQECSVRFGEDVQDAGSIFQRINRLFELLPLAALLQDKILCVHRGIGNSYTNITELQKIPRPLQIVTKPKTGAQSIVYHTLCGQPADRPSNSCDYNMTRLQRFTGDNGLNYIIRGTDSSVEGVEQYGKLVISICSCTDVKGVKETQGAILIIKKSYEIVVKTVRGSKSDRDVRWLRRKNNRT